MKIRIITSTLLTALLTVTISMTTFALPVSAYSNYVALGDSVASGAGLGANLDVTCDRSSFAYPTLLAHSLGTTVTNLACSGAKVDEGLYGSQVRAGTTLTPQIDAAFAGGTPDLMTITIGANDVRWASFVRDCYVFECGSTFDKARAVVYRADLRFELYQALYLIHQLSGGNPPTVLVNGYYNPFSAYALDCDATAEISRSEAKWLALQKNYLKDSLRSVTNQFGFAEFVHANFGGHKICTSDTWVQGPADAAPFHPNAAGQQALAELNLRALSR